MKVMSTLGVKGVLDVLVPAFESERAIAIEISLNPTLVQEQRIKAGERADVAILTRVAVDRLIGEGVLAPGSRVDLARSKVGFAVRRGAPRPDITSKAAVIRLLEATPSIVYSKAGASGLFFTGLLDRLGLRQSVDAKATIIPAGFTAELVADGRSALAVQQVSELMAVPGVDVIGPLPPDINDDLVFAGGVFSGTSHAELAAAFLSALSAPSTAALYREKGLFEI